MDNNFSVKLAIRKDSPRKDGTASLYLQVIINSEPKKIPLKLYWPVSKFDAGQILKRSRDDKDFADYNMIINQEINKVNEIFKYFRLSDQVLTFEGFIKHYNNESIKTDFVAYWENKMKERYKRKRMDYETFKKHKHSHGRLKEFRNPIYFYELTPKLLEEYEVFLRKKYNNADNTVWGRMKHIRAYCNFAREDNIIFNYPFDTYKVKYKQTDIDYLTRDEVKKLYDFWHSGEIKDGWKGVLRQFLFMCFTSLRISDVKRINVENIINNELVFIPFKKRKMGKILRIPLTGIARKFLDETKGELFNEYADQVCNRYLKSIASAVGIKKKITNHVGRHTFATMFLEMGGSVEVLQQIMGHENIKTTMIYVHITDQRKKEQLSFMENAI